MNGGSINDVPGPGSGRGGSRRLTNIEQQMLAEDNAAAVANNTGGQYGGGGARGGPGPAGLQGGSNGLGMYGTGTGGLGAPGAFRGAHGQGMLPGQFDDPSGGLAGLQAAQGEGLNAMNGLAARGLAGASILQQQQHQQQQQQAAQQQAMAAHQAQQFGGPGGAGDFQGLMPTGFDGADPSSNLIGNPAAVASYNPYGQPGLHYNHAGAGLGGGADGTQGLNPNAGAAGGARNQQFANPAAGAQGGPSLFDQGYNFARSEMALARHQAAFNNNAALMAGGGQTGLHLGNQAAGLRGLGPGAVSSYGNYGPDPLMGGGGPVGPDPYLSRGPADGGGGAASAQHLATIPAIRLAQHRSALQRRMLVNNLPERKDGSFPVVLYQESDEHKLTAYQCLLRKQLELFEADEDDVRCSTRQGRTAPIKLGQVGLRCRHCAGVQLAARTKGAAYYSQTVEGIYQIAQNMSKVHLCERCYRIPRDVRRQLIVLRSDCRRAIGGKEYWSENIRTLGVYVEEGILRVKKAPKEEESGEDKEGTDKKEEEVAAEIDVEKKEERDDAIMSIEGEEEKSDEKQGENDVVTKGDDDEESNKQKDKEEKPLKEEGEKDEKQDDKDEQMRAEEAEGEKNEEGDEEVVVNGEEKEKNEEEDEEVVVNGEEKEKNEEEDEEVLVNGEEKEKNEEEDEEVVVNGEEKEKNEEDESQPVDDTEEKDGEDIAKEREIENEKEEKDEDDANEEPEENSEIEEDQLSVNGEQKSEKKQEGEADDDGSEIPSNEDEKQGEEDYMC